MDTVPLAKHSPLDIAKNTLRRIRETREKKQKENGVNCPCRIQDCLNSNSSPRTPDQQTYFTGIPGSSTCLRAQSGDADDVIVRQIS